MLNENQRAAWRELKRLLAPPEEAKPRIDDRLAIHHGAPPLNQYQALIVNKGRPLWKEAALVAAAVEELRRREREELMLIPEAQFDPLE